MTIALLLIFTTATGLVIAPPAYQFSTLDLCDNARGLVTDDIINSGGTVHVARCAAQSLKGMK